MDVTGKQQRRHYNHHPSHSGQQKFIFIDVSGCGAISEVCAARPDRLYVPPTQRRRRVFVLQDI